MIAQITSSNQRAMQLIPPGRKLVQDQIDRSVARLRATGTPALGTPSPGTGNTERLYDANASFKVFTSQVAMHLDDDWRKKLFRSLDNLLDPESWEDDDLPPALVSFQTLMRLLLLLKPERRPGLGIDNSAHLVAAWTEGVNRLTVTCLENDHLAWTLRRQTRDGLVRAAGSNKITMMPKVLEPYEPSVWFKIAK